MSPGVYLCVAQAPPPQHTYNCNREGLYHTSTSSSVLEMSQPRNFSWFVAGKLAAMAYPTTQDLTFLKAQGIKTLINFSHRPSSYRESAEAQGLTVHSIPIETYYPPKTEQIENFLRIVDTAKSVSIYSMFSVHACPQVDLRSGKST